METHEYYEQLQAEISVRAHTQGINEDEAFFELCTEYLNENQEFEGTPAWSPYSSSQPTGAQGAIRIDGNGGDVWDNGDGFIHIFLNEFTESSSPQTINQSDVNQRFERGFRFIENAISNPRWRESLEDWGGAWELADRIQKRHQARQIKKYNVHLITNKEVAITGRGMVDLGKVKREPIDGIAVYTSILDLSRLNKGTDPEDREEMILDFITPPAPDGKLLFGGPLPALPAFQGGNNPIQSYLCVMPGEQLADIYDIYGDRLLESNVRVYLQRTTKVNQRILGTLQKEPAFFFPYNNGISGTAEDVEYKDGKITKIKNLQIVNGGQTTGSIVRSRSEETPADLSNVYVQMKITVVKNEETENHINSALLIERISEAANTQNPVRAADFFSNNEFHIQMERLSHRTQVPIQEGAVVQTLWFYERMRGQFKQETAKAKQAGAVQERRFKNTYPTHQKVNKEQFAKYLNTWDGEPHRVCEGPAKNFPRFMAKINSEYKTNPSSFNEKYFRDAISKGILFESTGNIISKRQWYQTGSGVRAPIIVYGIAKMSHDLRMQNLILDFDKIWNSQAIPESVVSALETAVDAVQPKILTQETSKSESTWKQVMSLEVQWPDSLRDACITEEKQAELLSNAKYDQRKDREVEYSLFVVNVPEGFWKRVALWGIEGGHITPREEQLMSDAALGIMPKTDKGYQDIFKAYERIKGILPTVLRSELEE